MTLKPKGGGGGGGGGDGYGVVLPFVRLLVPQDTVRFLSFKVLSPWLGFLLIVLVKS